MKYLRRAPREVYRVYDEEEFLADAARELGSGHHAHGGLIALMGGIVVLAGVASIVGGLLLLSRRVPVKREPRRIEGAGGALAVASAPSGRGRRRAGAERPPRGARLTVREKGHRGHRGRRGAAQRRLKAGRPSVTAQTPQSRGVERLAVAVRSRTAAVTRPEFGFER